MFTLFCGNAFGQRRPPPPPPPPGSVQWLPPRTDCPTIDYPCIQTTCDNVGRLAIATNPANPWNRQRPSMTNRFDWYTPLTYPLATPSSSLLGTGIVSPYNQITFLQRDANPKDGWELIKLDLGGMNNPYGFTVINPYIVVYNRFSSRLRIFFATGFPIQGQDLIMKMSFGERNNNRTSLLDFSNGVKAISQPFEDGIFSSVAEIEETPGHWAYCDFPMTYDPCTCGIENTEITVELRKAGRSTLNIQGIFDGRIETIASSNGVQGGTNSFSFGDVAKPFVKAFSTVKTFKDDLKGYFGEQSPVYKDFSKFLGGNNVLVNGFGGIAYVKAALAIFDLFTGGSSTEPVKLAPLSMRGTLTLSGNITSSQIIQTITFATPGSKANNVTDFKYPNYNEVLGVFNLINQPIVRAKESGASGGILNPWQSDGLWVEGSFPIYDFQLKEPIEYALNPAAGLEIQEMELNYVGDLTGLDSYSSGYIVNDEYDLRERGSFTQMYRDRYVWTNNVISTEILPPNCVNEVQRSGMLPKYLLIMLNLRRKDGGGPNILLSFRYPVKIEFETLDRTCRAQSSFVYPTQNATAFCASPAYTNGRISAKTVANTNTPTTVATTFSISPNPASNTVNIQYSATSAAQANIYLTNMSGQLATTQYSQTTVIGNNETILDVGHLPNGVYLVVCEVGGERNVQKLVILK